MFDLSCGFFCKKDSKSEAVNPINLQHPIGLEMNGNLPIVNLPMPASGYVLFSRHSQWNLENFMIIPVGTLLMAPGSNVDPGKIFIVSPDLVTPDYANTCYNSQYNAYICPKGKVAMNVMVVASLFDSSGNQMLGSMGNVSANTITTVPPGNPLIRFCDQFLNQTAFTNGTDSQPVLSNSNEFTLRK